MAKEIKKVKCKKCKLTYDKKKYECPYCHKKRFNPTGLIVFLVLLIVAAGALYYFKGNEIKDVLNNTNVTNESGLIFKNLSVTPSAEKANVYVVKFDIENKTGKSLDKAYLLVNLADKVKAPVLRGSFLEWNEDFTGVELHMLTDEIFKAEYEIKIENEWNKLEIYMREYIKDTEEFTEMKIFTYENNIEETTDVSIITE